MINQKGQTLIEVLAALGVSIVIITAIAVTVVSSLSNTESTKKQNLATQYAAQGIEVVRQIRDRDYSSLSPSNYPFLRYCLPKNGTELIGSGSSCPINIDGIFAREIRMMWSACPVPTGVSFAGPMIAAIVLWGDSKCPVANILCHKVELLSCLSTGDIVPTP